MFDTEKIMEAIKNVHPGSYDMTWQEWQALSGGGRAELDMDVYTAFKYGFLKGQRAAKAAAKRKAVRA